MGLRVNTAFRTVVALSIVYFGVPLLLHLFHPSSGSEILSAFNMVAEEPSLAKSTDAAPILLSLANVLVILRVALAFFISSLSYLVHLPSIAYFPVRHAFRVTSYVANLLSQPMQPIVAPVRLAVEITLTFVLVPALLVYKFATILYPLYVFLGAACICGALVGLSSRILGKRVVRSFGGLRSSKPLVGARDGKEIDAPRKGQLRAGEKGKGRFVTFL
ncbi:hypothetical protein DFH11DRAFT_1877421 [Phellopilus nigrolimitatus]|nr:hypothetical protein DFH11DRAFT_1877421 [Phellopilus nigrolimitatus]